MSITCNGLPAGVMHFGSTWHFSFEMLLKDCPLLSLFWSLKIYTYVYIYILYIYIIFQQEEKSPSFVHNKFPLIGEGDNSGTKTVALGEAHRLDSNLIKLACRHDCNTAIRYANKLNKRKGG